MAWGIDRGFSFSLHTANLCNAICYFELPFHIELLWCLLKINQPNKCGSISGLSILSDLFVCLYNSALLSWWGYCWEVGNSQVHRLILILPEKIGLFHGLATSTFQGYWQRKIWGLVARFIGANTKEGLRRCLVYNQMTQLQRTGVQPPGPQALTCPHQAREEGRDPDCGAVTPATEAPEA